MSFATILTFSLNVVICNYGFFSSALRSSETVHSYESQRKTISHAKLKWFETACVWVCVWMSANNFTCRESVALKLVNWIFSFLKWIYMCLKCTLLSLSLRVSVSPVPHLLPCLLVGHKVFALDECTHHVSIPRCILGRMLFCIGSDMQPESTTQRIINLIVLANVNAVEWIGMANMRVWNFEESCFPDQCPIAQWDYD